MPQTPTTCDAWQAIRPLTIVAHRVLEIVRDPGFAVDDLNALVRTDPALALRVLSLCNSARRGLGGEVTSIDAALNELGTRAVVQLARATCAESAGNRESAGAMEPSLACWRRGIACATACELLASRTSAAAPATAFTLGILHGLDDVTGAVESGLHAQDAIAATVAHRLELPVMLAQALQHHHDEQLLAGGALSALLHLGEHLARAGGADGDDMAPSPVALTRLQLGPADLRSAATAARARATEVTEQLNLAATTGR